METIEKPKASEVAKGPREVSFADKFPELIGVEDKFMLKLYDRDQLPATARPCEDETGRTFTGQGPTGHYETLSEESKNKLQYVVTPDSGIVLTDDKVFSVKNQVDMINWAWLRRHPYVSLNFAKGKASRDAVCYLYNPIHEANERVKSSRIKDKARYLIQFEMTRDQLIKAAQILGDLGAHSKTDTQLQDFLLTQAEGKGMAEPVLEACSKENSARNEAKILLTQLRQYKLIQRGEGGQHRFKGEKGLALGHDDELVLDFLMNEKNSDTVLMIKNELAKAKNIPLE